MAELKDYNNPYAFIDDTEWEGDESAGCPCLTKKDIDAVYDEFTQRCKDLFITLSTTRNYFEYLQGISQEEFAQLHQNSMESSKILNIIDGYASDLTNQMSYMHGVLTR